VLWPLGLCVLYYRNLCTVLYVSLTSEKTEKKLVGFRSRELSVLDINNAQAQVDRELYRCAT
jgi:hypothetical protein